LRADAWGVVVDLGAGIGLNLSHLGPAVSRLYLVEPDPHMIRRLPHDLPGHVEVHQTGAERRPLDDASIDTILATLTLCTVSDLPATVAEMRRVLRPDERILVLEHVRSLDPGLTRCQDWMRGPWAWFWAGCNLNRDTTNALADNGFDGAGLTRFHVPGMPLTSEWVSGPVG
jgi:SAM-dependent methyltransferase